MVNQSAQPQHGMAEQGFRPFTTTPLNSSVNGTSTLRPIRAPIQMPALPSNSADDGYIWKNLGLQEIQGSGRFMICYECSQANCTAKKSVTLSADNQILETVFRGTHNHPRPSEMCPRDVPTGYIPDSQHYSYVPSEMYVPGTSIPQTEEEDEQEQLGSSSASDGEDDGEQRHDGHVGSASATERHVVAAAERRTRSRTPHQNKKKRRRKSEVWEEFTKVFRDGILQAAVCKHCKSSLSAKTTGGTSHLKRHLKSCPARPATGRVQQQRPSSHPNSSVEKNSNLDQDKSLELLTKALASNLCSFSLTGNTNYRQFLAGICPTDDMVSQSAIQEKFLSIFQNQKLKLKEEISLAPGGGYLTLAKWVLGTNYFICVTAHFIDKEWNMIRRIIRCTFVGSEESMASYTSMFPDFQSYQSYSRDGYDGEPEAKIIIKEVIQSWGLDGKLIGISFPLSLFHTDIWGLQKNIEKQNHLVKNNLLSLPCITESLHGIIYFCVDSVVKKLSEDWLKYMTCSPLRTAKYKEILLQLQIYRPTFGSQKWYMAFYSLEAALQFNKVFPNPEQIDSKSYPSKPSDKKVQDTEVFCNFAGLVYDAIQVASSSHNSTLNSNFHTIWNLKIALSRSSENAQNLFYHDEMKKKFDELWEKWYLWLSLAVVLDPRYKIRFLDRSLKEAFGSDAKRYMLEVRGKICELFFRYSIQVDQQSGDCSNDSNNDLHTGADGHGSVTVHRGLRMGELDRYLEGDCVPENIPFDILNWWKGNASTYPTLALLARDILRIPACVVSAESAFDETDERVRFFLNRKLSPEVVEALICTQDWIKSSGVSSACIESHRTKYKRLLGRPAYKNRKEKANLQAKTDYSSTTIRLHQFELWDLL